MGSRRFWFLGCLLLVAGCGIKAPPRPPLDVAPPPGPALVDPPDAGCCAEVKP